MNAYRIASISLILTLICYLHPAFGFRYQNARWRLMDLPIPCYLNTDSIPEELATDDVEQAIIRSLAAWDEAAGLQIFEYAGRIQLESPLADDGWNAISFVLTDWLEVTDRLSVSRLVGATTCTWSVRDAIGAPPRHTFVKNDFLRAFDIVINAENYRWTIGAKVNQYDLQSIITHELGHVLSLGRPDADPHPADAPTMVERMFPTDTKLRTLEPDDIAGVQSIYRKASGTLREDAQWENMVFINWARLLFDDGKAPLIIPGQWITLFEGLPELDGVIREIPASALSGETINVRYTIRNRGQHAEGNQTVRFYLSRTLIPKPDYPLFPVIQLPALEGEWQSQLTVPADVPLGDYYLWMMVDADDDVIECDEYNRAVYRARPIHIGEIEEEEEAKAVNPHGKRPMMWASLKTELFQNFPNPFNPETWIPYQVGEDADVVIRIYNTKGQLVRAITLNNKKAGVYISKDKAAYWDGRDSLGEKVASGVYFYTLQVREAIPRIGAGDFRATRKMVVLE